MTSRRLDQIGVPQPCWVSWSSMTGSTDVTRTCATCARQVHDLSAMTETEAEALILRSTERICVRYVRGADGAIVTVDRPAKPIQKGPYAGLSAAALAAAVALSQPAGASAGDQAGSAREQAAPARTRAAALLTMGVLSGRIVDADDGTRVVVISESTGEEYVARTRSEAFSLELPAGSYSVLVDGDVASIPGGEGGVVVRSRRTATIKLKRYFRVIGEVVRLYPATPPPPLPPLKETPAAAEANDRSEGSTWSRLVDWARSLFR